MISISKRRNLLAGLASVFLLTSSMTIASVAVAQAASSEDMALGAFFGAHYDYCVAESLGAYWQVDPGQAKVMAGEKILRGDRAILKQVVKTARRAHPCTSGFLLDDTKSVADLWSAGAVAAS